MHDAGRNVLKPGLGVNETARANARVTPSRTSAMNRPLGEGRSDAAHLLLVLGLELDPAGLSPQHVQRVSTTTRLGTRKWRAKSETTSDNFALDDKLTTSRPYGYPILVRMLSLPRMFSTNIVVAHVDLEKDE